MKSLFRTCCLALVSILILNTNSLAATTPSVSASIWDNSRIIINGRYEQIADRMGGYNYIPVNFNGAIFVPLEVLGRMTNRATRWDATSNTVTFSSNSEIENLDSGVPISDLVPKVSKSFENYQTFSAIEDFNLSLDGNLYSSGNLSGTTITLLFANNQIYLPIRAICEAYGFEVTWVASRTTQTIFIRTPLTENQSAQIQSFLVDGYQLCDTFEASVDNFLSKKNISSSAALELLTDIHNILEDFKELAQPNAILSEPFYKRLEERVEKIDNLVMGSIILIENGTSIEDVFIDTSLAITLKGNTPALRGEIQDLEIVFLQ